MALMIPRNRAGVVRPEDNSRDLVTEKIGNELLLAFIPVKVNLVVERRFVMNDLSCDFIFCATAHDYFVCPHMPILVRMTSPVE